MKSAATFFLAILLFSCHGSYTPPTKTGLEGKPLPPFNLLLIDSLTTFNTDSIPKGKAVVLLFVSPKCPYCRAELRDILGKSSIFNSTRFYVFTNWSFKAFRKFYHEYSLDQFKNVTAGQDTKDYFSHCFGVTSVPCTAIYNGDKILQKVFLGEVSAAQIKEEIHD